MSVIYKLLLEKVNMYSMGVCVKNHTIDKTYQKNIYNYFNYSYSKALILRLDLELFNDRYTNKMICWPSMSTIDYAYKLIKKTIII